MWITKDWQIYSGDCQPGDRAATEAEVAADQTAKVAAGKANQSVTMRQARLQLLSMGLLNQVSGAINTMLGAQGDAIRIEWEFASQIVTATPSPTSQIL